LTPVLRSALGGVLAVALVSGGILGLQWLVPAPRGAPALGPGPVVTSPAPTSAAPTAPATTSPPTPPASTAGSPAPASPAAAALPAVTVLNNSRVTGLAAKAAKDFETRGWRISGTGNLGGRLAVTTVYYGEGQRDAAATLRAQFPAIKEMAVRYPGLPGEGGLTVVVTRDYPR
jgi:hypothetical protein